MQSISPIQLGFFSIVAFGQAIQIEEQMEVEYRAKDFHARRDGSVLIYDHAFFSRFEPVSVGDILKRLPGISGFADAGEFDQPQLRGLPPSYTRILINGRPIPENDDRSASVDWIPAIAVERIELTRSPSSDVSAEGAAGTINIVLKQAGSGTQTLFTAGVVHSAPDQQRRGRGSLTFSRERGAHAFTLTGAYRQRHNPKVQTSVISDAEDQSSTFKRESNDLDRDEFHFNTNHRYQFDSGLTWETSMFFHDTDRIEDERSIFTSSEGESEAAFDLADIDRRRYGVELDLSGASSNGSWRLNLSHDGMNLMRRSEIGEGALQSRSIQEIEQDGTRDRSSGMLLSWLRSSDSPHDVRLGVELGQRLRDADLRILHLEQGAIVRRDTSGVFQVRERRADGFVSHRWSNASWSTHSGIRLEHRELDTNLSQSRETGVYPSIHVVWARGPRWALHASLARTTRRPAFRDLVPTPQRDRPREDDITIGNPDLNPEHSWGLDIGIDHKLNHGSFGVNAFLRTVDHLIELRQLDENRFQPTNTDHGRAWGLELDLGTPLHGIGAPNLSIFANASIHDSRVTDPLTGESRRFNFQSNYVANAGFIQAFPIHGLRLGLTYLTQGNGMDIESFERADIDFGDDLEAVVEKAWGTRWTLRLSAGNLTDAARREKIQAFDGLRGVSDVTETTFETERSGRILMITLSGTF